MRFPIRFGAACRFLFAALLLTPSDSFVEIEGDEVRVRMAWVFRARFPRSAVVSVTEHQQKPLSRGAHRLRRVLAREWLRRGHRQHPPGAQQRGYGFPVRIRNLLVSVEDPPT